MSDENRSWNDQELDDLLAEYNIAAARKQQKQSAASPRPAGVQNPSRGGNGQRTENHAVSAPGRDALQNRSHEKTFSGEGLQKSDGTSYSIEELRQIQASRRAVHTRQGQSRSGMTENRTSSGQQHARQTSPQAAYQAAYSQQDTVDTLNSRRQNRPSYRQRKPNKPNGAILLIVLLMVAVGAISVGQIVQNRSEAESNTDTDNRVVQEETGETEEEGEETEPATETPEETEPPEEELVLWNTTVVDNADVHRGELLLVNYQYLYPEADTIAVKDIYGNRNGYYKLASSSIALRNVALTAFNTMTDAFYQASGVDDMIVNSGYRNVESQQEIYDDRVQSQGKEMADLYVATPGYSEHHTGLAVDLSFYTDEGATVSIATHEFGYWLNENCADYGFILRYPEEKVEITKIAYEFWHYRYVGYPHAKIITEKNLCLEEYVETFIKEYSIDSKLLWIQPDGLMADVSPTALPGEGTLVYYVPAAEGETTEVRVPRGNIFADTDISGNNVDGFIVTVHIG